MIIKRDNGTILIYGKHSVMSVISNPMRKVLEVFCIDNSALKELSSLSGYSKGTKITVIKDKRLFERVTGTEGLTHQNIVVLTLPLAHVSIEQIIHASKHKNESTIVLLDNVVDPHNIGAILRSCAAFNVDALVLMKNNSPDINNPIIYKTSSGGYEFVPLCTVTNLASTMNLLKKNDYWCYGLSLDHKNLQSLNDVKFAPKRAIIMGAEHSGLRRLTLENIDEAIYIPIKNIDSLNVSVAAGIVLSKLVQ